MINMDVEEIFRTICETNNKHIERGDKIIPTVFFIGETITPYQMPHMKKANRETYEQHVKTYAVKSGQSYILVMDTIARHHGIIGDCIMRALYTPTKKVINLAWYKGLKISATEEIEGRNHMVDKWDAWNQGTIEILNEVKK